MLKAMDADRAAEAASDGRGAAVAIECRGVVKTYRSRQGEVAAVRGVDLAIAEGEFFSMLGPSGCGKTTTLRMIGGFEDPTGGRILLQGRDVTSAPPDKRDVNMVFQNYALFPHLNVWQNVAFGLRRRHTPKGEIRRRVAEMLDLVQLTGRESRSPNELSGGQQQRVALARALVNRPRALLLDEPLGALDLKLRQAMQSEIKRIQREVGITFVYVTHDQSEALTMSDRLAVMNDGVIEQMGTPQEVYERPETRFVAGFIGTSNVLSAEITRLAGDVALIDVSPDERIALPVEPSLQPRERVDVTVRPEKVTISSTPREAESIVRGRVTEVAYLGTSTSYRVVTSLHAEVVAFRQNDTGVAPLAEGDEVWLSWDASNSFRIPGEDAA